jgi:hypothetical protein
MHNAGKDLQKGGKKRKKIQRNGLRKDQKLMKMRTTCIGGRDGSIIITD